MKFEFHPTRLSNLAVGQKLSARVIGVWCSETGVKSEDQPRGYNWGYGNLLTIGPHNRDNSQFTVRDFVFFLWTRAEPKLRANHRIVVDEWQG
jgi:hypothetical protein